LEGLFENLKGAETLPIFEGSKKMKKSIVKAIITVLIVVGFAFMAYSYQTGISTDLWIAYIVTGIPIAIGVVIAILILFLLILRFATRRKITKTKSFRGLEYRLNCQKCQFFHIVFFFSRKMKNL